jgi:ectoine hydroxylase-related dioxygenase (phytanoyl-CoA dioxygenase family)
MEQSQAGTFLEALTQLGVTEDLLSSDEKKALDEKGYVIFPGLIDDEWLEQLRRSFETLIEKEKYGGTFVFGEEGGVRRLSDLINKGEVWDRVWLHPKVLAAAWHVIGREFKVNSINARDALPGEGHQRLHADWGPRKKDELFHGINSLWLLDDFLPNNGATRLVPGTHVMEGKPADYMEDTMAPHPDEIIPQLKAGTVITYNFHLWHGGTKNETELMRRVLHPSFVAREFPQQYDQKEFLRKTTYDRLSPAARYLLDV